MTCKLGQFLTNCKIFEDGKSYQSTDIFHIAPEVKEQIPITSTPRSYLIYPLSLHGLAKKIYNANILDKNCILESFEYFSL